MEYTPTYYFVLVQNSTSFVDCESLSIYSANVAVGLHRILVRSGCDPHDEWCGTESLPAICIYRITRDLRGDKAISDCAHGDGHIRRRALCGTRRIQQITGGAEPIDDSFACLFGRW